MTLWFDFHCFHDKFFWASWTGKNLPPLSIELWREKLNYGKMVIMDRYLEQHEAVLDFYRYFHGHCSQEIKNIIPDPVRRVRTTRSSTYSHPFQVTLPNPRTLSHKSSFIPWTSQLWNSLPPTTFPESYNLSSFKSNINKLDLISLST